MAAQTQKRRTKAQVTEDIARAYFDAVAAADPNAVAAVWAGEGIGERGRVGIFGGPAEIRGFFIGLFAAFPDWEFEVEQVIASAGVAAVQWRARGTFRGAPFQGVDPNGRRIEMRGCDCLE